MGSFLNRSFFSAATLIVPLLFAPFTALILLSQNTVPGNLLYPYKRGLEVMILAAASLNPATKAYFHAGLSDRRYTEAESLLLAKKDISGLTSFVDEVKVTETAIANVSDPRQQEQMQQDLIAKIDDYQNRLAKVQTQVVSETQQQAINQFTTTVDVTTSSVVTNQQGMPNPTQIPQTSQQSGANQPTVSERGTITPTITSSVASSSKSPTQQNPTPTSTIQIPTPTTVVSQPPPPSVTTVGVAISDTQEELKKIKEKLKKENKPETTRPQEKETDKKGDSGSPTKPVENSSGDKKKGSGRN